MTRVSENSSTQSINYALNKAKSKLEDLQLKGASLKQVRKPSDDPIANVEALNITAVTNDNKQYARNIGAALIQLGTTEKVLEQVTDSLMKVKEIAVQQASDFYDVNARKNVANEVIQIRNHLLSLANKKISNRYIFSGQATLTRPFDHDGKYSGDNGHIMLEISKDFFVPINLAGSEVFFETDISIDQRLNPLSDFKKEADKFDDKGGEQKEINRSLASVNETQIAEQKDEIKQTIFDHLNYFVTALENDDSSSIQNLLEKIDSSISRVITLRTRVGSIVNSVDSAKSALEVEDIDNAKRRSDLVDADVAELFSDISRQKQVLDTTYKSGQHLVSKTLLDFIR